jgi:AmmeMemoRadiSam system protein B
MDADIRQPAVAGAFYPKQRRELESALYSLVPEKEAHHELLACISPHAGYMYSGSVAGRLFAHLTIPERVIVLGPNHTGVGAQVAVAPHTGWETPLGEQPVDTEFARRLVEVFPEAEFDPKAHWREHSIEVQLPFLMRRRPDLRVLPVVVKGLGLDECLEFGHVIAKLISGFDGPVGIVASSDMSHYQPDEITRTLDHLAIDAALVRDPAGLYETVRKEGISMCGVIPATVALAAANDLGAVDAHLVAYATSGDVSGDYSSVVGYAGVCIHR